MLAYARDKLILSVLVLLTVSLIGFALLRVSGDLAVSLAGENATAAQIEELRQRLGLDRSLLVQYLDWLSHALRGDLGASFFTQEPVAKLFAQRIGVTAAMALSALVLALAVSIPLGTVAALRPNSWIDRLASVLALGGQALPGFWLGLMMISLFGVTLRWLPISGSATPAHFVLPVAVLAMGAVPALMRLMRSGMLEVLEQDYIRTARSKGLPVGVILLRHALRNALLPVVSLAAVQLGALLGGSVIVETVFAIEGIGLLTYRSIQRNDFPVVQAMLVFVSVCYVLLTLLADLLNAWLDPRLLEE